MAAVNTVKLLMRESLIGLVSPSRRAWGGQQVVGLQALGPVDEGVGHGVHGLVKVLRPQLAKASLAAGQEAAQAFGSDMASRSSMPSVMNLRCVDASVWSSKPISPTATTPSFSRKRGIRAKTSSAKLTLFASRGLRPIVQKC